MNIKKKSESFVRSNTRILPADKKYIKDYAKKIKKSEGYVWRMIVQNFIKNN